MLAHVIMVEPEIPWNTGNAGRSCLAFGAQLHLVGPLGFSLTDKYVRRSGLDYWSHVAPKVWSHWDDFAQELPNLGQVWTITPDGNTSLWQAALFEKQQNYQPPVLLFGKESAGLPKYIREQYQDRSLYIPMPGSEFIRSLNVSTVVGITLTEVLRQKSLLQENARACP